MKTSKVILTLLLLLSFKFCFAWDFTITAPTGSSCWPTNYYYNGGQTYVNINFDISGSSSSTYTWYVRITQGGSSYNTPTSSGGPEGTKTVQISYSNICFNNDAQIDVFVKEDNGAYLNKTKYFRLYSETGSLGCITGLAKLVAVDGENYPCQNPNNCAALSGTFYNGPGCGLASSNYQYKKYKVEWTKSGNFSNSTITIHDNLCNGYSGAIPNYQNRWGWVDNITSSSAHFYTFVYHVYNGAQWQWYPCSPQDAAVVYSVISNPSPIISGFTQIPSIIYPGGSGTVTCNLSQGNCCNVSYNWSYTYKPNFMSVSFSGNTATITNNYSALDKIDGDLVPQFSLTCQVSNNYGSQTSNPYAVLYSTNGGGCPWMFVQTDDSMVFTEENNILHRSEFTENEGEDITDIYKLNSVPYISDDEIKIKILETGRKYSYFDQFRLYIVDHSTATEVGVTEDNEIVLFTGDNVVSTDTANLNGTEDITNMIQYPFTLEGDALDGDTLDQAYVHYPSNSFTSFAVITNMDYDRIVPIAKTNAANITCYTSVGNASTSFAMRELSHEIIVPIDLTSLANITVYNANLTYQRHFSVTYVALATLTPVSSYDEAGLVSAELSNVGDITSFLTDVDQEYGEMDSLSSITLTFSTEGISEPGENETRDYIFVCVGRYVGSNPNDNNGNSFISLDYPKDEILLNQPSKYKLYTNYPNPFNPSTLIKYDIKNNGLVKLGVYNVMGQLVKELVNTQQDAGSYTVTFDGSKLASGVYFYKLESGDFVDSKKMVLIK